MSKKNEGMSTLCVLYFPEQDLSSQQTQHASQMAHGASEDEFSFFFAAAKNILQ